MSLLQLAELGQILMAITNISTKCYDSVKHRPEDKALCQLNLDEKLERIRSYMVDQRDIHNMADHLTRSSRSGDGSARKKHAVKFSDWVCIDHRVILLCNAMCRLIMCIILYIMQTVWEMLIMPKISAGCNKFCMPFYNNKAFFPIIILYNWPVCKFSILRLLQMTNNDQQQKGRLRAILY